MATFKAEIRTKRTDGLYLVYIRVTHNRKNAYIKTDWYVRSSKVKEGVITDQTVLGQCAIKIKGYLDKLNNAEDVNSWSVKEVVDFLKTEYSKIPFIPYCQKFIDKMVNEGREKSASNYKCAKKSFETFFGKDITFQGITSYGLTEWIKSLKKTARAKETYPKAIKAIFDAGCLEFNDYDRNNIYIHSQPFKGVKIPKHDLPQKRAIDAASIKSILQYDAKTKQTEKAQDVAKLIIYLVGMNTVDLFNLEEKNLKKGKICYNRSKTKDTRDDKAYIEIGIHPDIKHLFKKYKGEKRLLEFGYSNDRSFNKHINIGLKTICKDLGLPPVDTYTFRHSWATIAHNDCGASDEQIAFCLNHGSAHKVTIGYIKKSFTRIDELNNKVIDFILNAKIEKKTSNKKAEKPKEQAQLSLFS